MAKPIKRGNMWYSDYREGGRRIRRPLSKDKREAQRLLDGIMLLRRAEKYGDMPQDIDWPIYKERFLNWARNVLKPGSVGNYELYFGMMEQSAYPRRLREITPEYLERLRTIWKQEGKTESTIMMACVAVKAAMRKAEDWKFIHPQNWRMVKFPEKRNRLLFYSIEEMQRLLQCSPGVWRTAILLMGKAGLRRGEVFNLEWSDIDFANNRILIRCKELSDGTYWEPKKKKERMIQMDEELRADLESHQKRQGFILGAIRKHENTFYLGIKHLLKTANLSGSPHTLRHTFASHLAMAGVPLIQIKELLGHEDIQTVQIYAHLSPESQRQAITALPKLLGSNLGSNLRHTSDYVRSEDVVIRRQPFDDGQLN